MLVAGFPAGPWGTNCWVAAAAAGSECIVIDPGFEAAGSLKELLLEHRLRPVAVLLTHGHMDHMWSVTPVADGYGIPAVVHEADRELLAHPERAVSVEAAAMIEALGGEFVEPASVQVLTSDLDIEFAGLRINVQHTPGHTRGSVVFGIAEGVPVLFSGDLLFQGSIGRTDLPGGDPTAMMASLQRVFDKVPDRAMVHCGHGPSTTIGRERASNPYLPSSIRRPV